MNVLEDINKALLTNLGVDKGTQNIDRILRVPGTFNFKLENRPRPVKIVQESGEKYEIEDFLKFVETKENQNIDSDYDEENMTEGCIMETIIDWEWEAIQNLPISDKIKSLILNGNDGSYPSRSEADMAVITSLVKHGISEKWIEEIFTSYPIGEKYREHPAPDEYLKHNIKEAKKLVDFTDEELQDPLFLSGAITKKDRRYHLNIVKFEEHMRNKYKLKILEGENALYKYGEKCYEHCSMESLNNLCQTELKEYRSLFTKSGLKDFIHYLTGDSLIYSQLARDDQIRYLTLQNGLFDLNEMDVISHTSEIFTTNLLPYKHDPEAKCPRFLQYLNEVFLKDTEKIQFIQEIVGYGFHKSIPTPAIFLFLGKGSNGKSVFIDTITNLFGEDNVCSLNFNALMDQYYILELINKMINVSSESSSISAKSTNIIKAVVGGDWVSGRAPYKEPTKFKPFAKHYLAMNEFPMIKDSSHGMWRRIYIIQFPRTFSEEEEDKELTNKLKEEASGIFNWALEGLERLRKKNFIFIKVRSMELAKQTYKKESNSILEFVDECIFKSDNFDDGIKFSDAYLIYKNFCESNGHKYLEKKNEFKRVLQSQGLRIEKSTKDANQVFIFGARLTTD